MKSLLLTAAFCLSFFASTAQSSAKFGKNIESSFSSDYSELSDGAPALIIIDQGDVDLEIRGANLVLEKSRLLRIKVLNEDGLDRRFFKLRFMHKDGFQDYGSIKAATYNYDGKKVSQTKLSKKAMITTKENDEWSSLEFELPEVEVGSIIEVEYVLSQVNDITISDWYFEQDIPTAFSSFNVTLPQGFNYDTVLAGQRTLADQSVSRTKINVQGLESIPGSRFLWEMKNIPAMDFSAAEDQTNRAHLDFSLKYVNGANEFVKFYRKSAKDNQIEFKENMFAGQVSSSGHCGN